jgi:hypothetical protein
VVEHSTADREVPGSNPGAPSITDFFILLRFNFCHEKTRHSYNSCGPKHSVDPDVTRTRNLLIWSQTRYHCATGSS